MREWAIRQGWGGRPVRQEQAQGILIAALGMLAGRASGSREGSLKLIAAAPRLEVNGIQAALNRTCWPFRSL